MIAPMSPETKTKLRRFRLEAKSIIQISVGIAGLVLIFVLIWSRIGVVHAQASRDASSKVNVLGCQILAFVDNQVSRSTKALAATEASPASTADIKRVARANLSGLIGLQTDAHRKLAVAHIRCPKKTVTVTGTSTPRLPLHATTTTSTRRTASAP